MKAILFIICLILVVIFAKGIFNQNNSETEKSRYRISFIIMAFFTVKLFSEMVIL